MNARDGGGGAEHGAQGDGFHSSFHWGPAIVSPSLSHGSDLSSHGLYRAGSRMADTEISGCLSLWSFQP